MPFLAQNAKFAVADDQIPNGGPHIKAGDGVRWSDWQMARDPEIWGPDCVEFKPSRFIDENGKFKQYGQWKAHMFNVGYSSLYRRGLVLTSLSVQGGPRICLGMNLATFEAVAAMVELVRNFDLDFAPGWYASPSFVSSSSLADSFDARRWESVPKTLGIIDGPIEPLYAASVTLPMKAPMLLTARKR